MDDVLGLPPYVFLFGIVIVFAMLFSVMEAIDTRTTILGTIVVATVVLVTLGWQWSIFAVGLIGMSVGGHDSVLAWLFWILGMPFGMDIGDGDDGP
jgi:hypothetical protein